MWIKGVGWEKPDGYLQTMQPVNSGVEAEHILF